MHMEPDLSQVSAQQENQDFVWNRSIMSSKLNIKIGDDEFFHPFPARTEMKIKSNDLYEKLESLNAITQLVSRIMIIFFVKITVDIR